MKNFFIGLLITCAFIFDASAQFNQPWQGKKCAVVLTYDDAINQHLDNAIPVLDSLGLKATFYLTAFSTSMQTRLKGNIPHLFKTLKLTTGLRLFH